MPRRIGAVHVATIRRTHKGRVYECHLRRRTFRRNGKVCYETLGNISHLPGHIIEMIRGALRGESYVSAPENWEIVRTRPHGHVAAVLGTLRAIGLEEVPASRPCRDRDLTVALIVARILDPRSKLATARGLRQQTSCSTLGESLGLGATNEDDPYAAMDWLLARQHRIENKLARKHQPISRSPVLESVIILDPTPASHSRFARATSVSVSPLPKSTSSGTSPIR